MKPEYLRILVVYNRLGLISSFSKSGSTRGGSMLNSNKSSDQTLFGHYGATRMISTCSVLIFAKTLETRRNGRKAYAHMKATWCPLSMLSRQETGTRKSVTCDCLLWQKERCAVGPTGPRSIRLHADSATILFPPLETFGLTGQR